MIGLALVLFALGLYCMRVGYLMQRHALAQRSEKISYD